jgi:protocatechuate 3,4-dioxygenase beta subunit
MIESKKKMSRVSRRDTLKVCILPAGALVAARWLAACGDEADARDGRDGLLGDAGGAAPPADASASNAPSGADAGVPTPSGAASSDAAAPADANVGAAQSDAAPSASADASSGLPQQEAGVTVADASADASVSDASVGAAGWASGGTKSMQGGYPDPFGTGPGSACALYPAQTLGPCYAQTPPTREDISAGLSGLPMRLSFLVVRSDGCTPVPNASVDIWHSGSNGIYSAFRTSTVCNPGTMDVLSQTFCRGVQTTNASGRTDFNTVFPGWYTGRTLHIHFTVRVNGREYITSQLYFEDALAEEILAQGEYKARGKRDTSNARDTQFRTGGATPEQVIFSTAKRADGALHAWKVLSLRGA